MCEVSGQLQLCTCAKVELDNAKHYWVYHRFVKGQELNIVGEPVLPYGIDEMVDLRNRKLLGTILNEKMVFDIPFHPKNGDLLELSFQIGNNFHRITYGFKYMEGKWVEETYDVFAWKTYHKEIKQGKIINAIKNKDD